jgi:hypothetical protein
VAVGTVVHWQQMFDKLDRIVSRIRGVFVYLSTWILFLLMPVFAFLVGAIVGFAIFDNGPIALVFGFVVALGVRYILLRL